MKIAMINASPRLMIRKNDTSITNLILQDIRRIVRRNRKNELEDHHLKTGIISDGEIQKLMECDAWLIVFPVLSSGLPSHMLTFMEKIEYEVELYQKEIQIYAIGHTPLYEGSEAFPSLHMLTHWCEKCHFSWGGGLGVGASTTHLMSGVTNFTHRRKRGYMRRLSSFGEAVSKGIPILNAGCTTDMNKKTYVLWHNRFIKKAAKNNGIKAVDIKEQP